jgi:ATP-dependent exoDNAse (exonuclease V) alpha subunit
MPCRYTRSTFPLAFAYAMTGHKCQGATFRCLTIIDILTAFTPGLLYVMLSRVTKRDNLRIVGGLSPEMFVPVNLPMWN